MENDTLRVLAVRDETLEELCEEILLLCDRFCLKRLFMTSRSLSEEAEAFSEPFDFYHVSESQANPRPSDVPSSIFLDLVSGFVSQEVPVDHTSLVPSKILININALNTVLS